MLLSEYSSSQLIALRTLLQSEFVEPLVDNGNIVQLERLLGHSMFTRKAYYREHGFEVYTGKWDGKQKKTLIRTFPTSTVLVAYDDDIFGTIHASIHHKLLSVFPKADSLFCLGDNCACYDCDLGSIYKIFDVDQFENIVITSWKNSTNPYSRTNADAYSMVKKGVKDLQPPDQCNPDEKLLWGQYYNTIARFFIEFRKEVVPPVFLDGFAPEFGDMLMMLLPEVINTWEKGKVVIPYDRETFTPVEVATLIARYPHAKLVNNSDNNVPFYYLPAADNIDVFSLIGSKYVHIVLPELLSIDKPLPLTSNSASLEQALVISKGKGPDNFNDGYDEIRAFLYKYSVMSHDLNLEGMEFIEKLKNGFGRATNFIDSASKNVKNNVVRKIPEGKNPLPIVMSAILAGSKYQDIVWFAACKIVLCKGQFIASIENGEVFIKRANT